VFLEKINVTVSVRVIGLDIYFVSWKSEYGVFVISLPNRTAVGISCWAKAGCAITRHERALGHLEF